MLGCAAVFIDLHAPFWHTTWFSGWACLSPVDSKSTYARQFARQCSDSVNPAMSRLSALLWWPQWWHYTLYNFWTLLSTWLSSMQSTVAGTRYVKLEAPSQGVRTCETIQCISRTEMYPLCTSQGIKFIWHDWFIQSITCYGNSCPRLWYDIFSFSGRIFVWPPTKFTYRNQYGLVHCVWQLTSCLGPHKLHILENATQLIILT